MDFINEMENMFRQAVRGAVEPALWEAWWDAHAEQLKSHLAGEYQHQGYGTEALKAYVEWLRAGKKATYIYASVHPDNQASLNMTKKCGLVQCGFRQYEDTGFVDEPYFELILD